MDLTCVLRKDRHTSCKKVFLRGYLKGHRTQGLMSSLSKPGVNATTETFSRAETLGKAVAPACYPFASLGDEMSPGNSSDCASLCLFCFASKGEDGDRLFHSGVEV